MVTFKQIETFFNNYKFEKNVLKLDVCTTITDLKKYVNTNIHLLKVNSGKKVFLPYYERLFKVYLKLKENDRRTKEHT